METETGGDGWRQVGVEGVCGVWERVVKEHGKIKGLPDCVLPLQVTSRGESGE